MIQRETLSVRWPLSVRRGLRWRCPRMDSRRQSRVKARPKWLKALGLDSPPETLRIADVPHRLVEVFKHDSWAATALYEGPERRLRVVKLHRQSSLLGLPMGWLGRRTARNERQAPGDNWPV